MLAEAEPTRRQCRGKCRRAAEFTPVGLCGGGTRAQQDAVDSGEESSEATTGTGGDAKRAAAAQKKREKRKEKHKAKQQQKQQAKPAVSVAIRAAAAPEVRPPFPRQNLPRTLD